MTFLFLLDKNVEQASCISRRSFNSFTAMSFYLSEKKLIFLLELKSFMNISRYSDLLVGAPYHSYQKGGNEGRVYVYINRKVSIL